MNFLINFHITLMCYKIRSKLIRQKNVPRAALASVRINPHILQTAPFFFHFLDSIYTRVLFLLALVLIQLLKFYSDDEVLFLFAAMES